MLRVFQYTFNNLIKGVCLFRYPLFIHNLSFPAIPNALSVSLIIFFQVMGCRG